MAVVDLPEWPLPQAADPLFLDAGATLKGGLGASDQKINRMGSRFGIAVTMPVMKSGKAGRQWVARLIRAQTDGARMEWPLLDFDPGLPGSIVVDGADQAGSTLNLRGATANYIAREGQFFSIETGGVHHIYMVAEETLFDASGVAALPVAPMLRAQHADADVCHFGQPMIEGLLIGDARQWSLAIGGFVGLSFEIHERK